MISLAMQNFVAGAVCGSVATAVGFYVAAALCRRFRNGQNVTNGV